MSAGRWRNHASGGMYVGTRPVVSPDGFSIVYSTPATGHGDIYLFDRRNGKNLRLTSDPEYDGYAFFSNAGKIVFIREKDGIGHIWVMNADGSRQKQLTDGLTDDGVPSPSRDGMSIVYCRVRGGISHIWAMDRDGGNQKQLTDGVWFDGVPCFSPDGARVAFSRQEEVRPFSSKELGRFPMRFPEIFVMNPDGTRTGAAFTHKGNNDSPIAFSPDGNRLYFLREDHDSVNGFRGVSVMGVDGSKRQDLAKGYTPALSGDGRRIAIGTSRPSGIGMMNSDGTGFEVVHSCKSIHSEPALSADGTLVVFVEWPKPNGAGQIRIVDLKTSRVDTVPAID